MPIGILTDVSATAIGAVAGCFIGSRLADNWKNMLNNIMGMAALFMGITLMLRANSLSAVVLSVLLGACCGEVFKLELRINHIATSVIRCVMGGAHADEEKLMKISAVLILFCCGGTGWYGAFNEGLTGDGSILVTKAILDCVTACIFAALLGRIIICLTVPQIAVYMTLFAVSGFVQPFITPAIIADFSAVGGIVTFVAGLRLTGIKRDIEVLNLLPALIFAFFVSGIWTALFA